MLNKKIFYTFQLVFIFALSIAAQNFEQGIKLINEEKYSEAKKFFLPLTNSGDASEAFFYLGEIYYHEDKPDSAAMYYKKGIEDDDDNALNFAGLVKVNLLTNNTAEVEKNMEEALDVGEKNAEVYSVLADGYSHPKVHNLDKAIELLNRGLKFAPKDADLRLTLGKMYLQKGNGTDAIKNFQDAINIDPKNSEALTQKAKVYILINNIPDAINLLNDAIANDPSYSPAYRELAELYANQKDYKQAADYYQKYMETSEVTTEKQKRFAQILYVNQEYQRAIDVLKEVIKAEPNNASSYRILAYAYLRLEDAQNSMQYFKQLFEVPDGDFTASDYENYAELLSKTGNDSLAIQNYIKTIELDSSKGDLHGKIAGMFFKNKDYERAAEHFNLKEQVTGKPLSLRENFDLGTALTINKNYTEADSVFGKIISSNPELPLGYLMRARVQATVDSTSELGLAKPYYEKFIDVVAASPDSAKYTKDLVEANRYLGYFYYLKREDPEYKANWRENYRKYWGRVLELDPENVSAKDALEALKTIK